MINKTRTFHRAPQCTIYRINLDPHLVDEIVNYLPSKYVVIYFFHCHSATFYQPSLKHTFIRCHSDVLSKLTHLLCFSVIYSHIPRAPASSLIVVPLSYSQFFCQNMYD